MKPSWQQLAAKIDALALRERVLIFLMLVVVMLALVNATILSKEAAKASMLSQQIAQDQSQIAGIQAEIQGKVAAFKKNPDEAKLTHLNEMKRHVAQMREALGDMQKGLVSPDRMADLLQDILKHNGKLRLVSLRTLPVSSLTDPDPVEKKQAETSATESAGQKATAPESALPKSVQSAVASDMAEGVVYKHGVEIVIEGDYLDMVDYMSSLESMPWQLFWGKAKLSVEDSGKRNLTLTLYTLSLDKKWLNI